MGLLYDLDALNRFCKLQDPASIVEFHAHHAMLLEPAKLEQTYFDIFENYPELLERFTKMGLGYTGLYDGQIMCCFGIIPLWRGSAEIWMVPSKHLYQVARPFHRATKLWLDVCIAEWHLVRVQATVHSQNAPADKWIRTCHFQEEGLLRRYGPEGADYKMFSRLGEKKK